MRVVEGAQIRLVDDQGADVPNGEIGELLVRGPNVFAFYWGDRAATAQALKDGWYQTGDLMRRGEGNDIWFDGSHADAAAVSGYASLPHGRLPLQPNVEGIDHRKRGDGEAAGNADVGCSRIKQCEETDVAADRLFPRVAMIALQQRQPSFLYQRIAANLKPIAIRHMQSFR